MTLARRIGRICCYKLCAPHRIYPCVFEACLLVIKIQMVFSSLGGFCRRWSARGKYFLFFLASAFYTQFDTFRWAENLQAYVAPQQNFTIKKSDHMCLQNVRWDKFRSMYFYRWLHTLLLDFIRLGLYGMVVKNNCFLTKNEFRWEKLA